MKRQARRRSPPASRRSHYQKEMRLRTVIFIIIMLMTTAYQTAQGKRAALKLSPQLTATRCTGSAS